MRKLFAIAAAALPILAATPPAQAQLFPPSLEKRIVNLPIPNETDAVMRARAVNIARCTVDTIFPYGANIDSHLARTYSRLTAILNETPKASYDRRDQLHKEAYNIRLQLEGAGYHHAYVRAAQTAVMATNTGYIVSEYGNEYSPVYWGSSDAQVSLLLTQKAAEGAAMWQELRKPSTATDASSCKR